MINRLFQPILSYIPESKHSYEDVLSVDEFIRLLRDEEDYYANEQINTKLMISRLRKIFYDTWGWDKILIRGASSVNGRYKVKEIVINSTKILNKGKIRISRPIINKTTISTYTESDAIYPDRCGEIPLIFASDHQEVRLLDGSYCDMAHVLAGLDAFNHRSAVSFLPQCFFWAKKIFPYNDKNEDIITWLGDIASAAGNFIFSFLNNGLKISDQGRQVEIDKKASGSDILGDIDSYVIACSYKISDANGLRLTDILYDYYGYNTPGQRFRLHRFSIFCNQVGLKNFNGQYFENEETWIKYYIKQLRYGSAFCVFSQLSNIKGLLIAFGIWIHVFDRIIVPENLLRNFLMELKRLLALELKASSSIKRADTHVSSF